MENPTLSIERFKNAGGQLGLALFLGVCVHCNLHAQVTVAAEFEQLASAGYLKPSHWLGENLNHRSRNEWILQNSAIGFHHVRANWRWQLERTSYSYLSANSNALLFAAQNEDGGEVNLSAAGQFELRAEAWTLKATTLSAVYTWKVSDAFVVAVEPHLHLIHDFQHTQGNLHLFNSAGSTQLSGQISKTGTRHYGYLPNDQRDEGIGAGLHLRSTWRRSWGQWDAAIQNVLSEIQFNAIHQQNRQYNVTAQDRKLKIADYPSVTGQYGIVRSREHLPINWKISVSPDRLLGSSLGLIGLRGEVRWTALYSLPVAGGQLWAMTVQARNWTLGYAKSLGVGWRVAAGVSGDERLNNPLLSTLSLIRTW